MWLLTTILYILIPLQSSFLNVTYKVIHLLAFLAFLLIVLYSVYRKRIDTFNGKQLSIILGMGVVMFLSTLTTSEKVSFDPHLINIFCFLETLLAIYIIDMVAHDEATEAFVFRVNIIIALVFCILSRTSYAYSHIIADSLSLGYSNPNATAIYLLMNLSLLLLYTVRLKQLWKKIAVYVLCAYLFYLLYETDSRACLFAAVAVVAYVLLAPKWRIPTFFVSVFMLLPLFFLFFYTSLYQTGKYTDLTILGKPFYSGREAYFINKLEQLKSYWLIGNVGLNPFNNMHNGALALMSSCGVLGYALYLRYIDNTIRHYYRKNVTHQQTVALIVILATFLHSCAEAALIVGGANYSIVVATFYWLLKGKGTTYGIQKNPQ